MAAQSTIVYADLDTGALQRPAAVAETIVRAAQDSLAAGQFDVARRPLSVADMAESIRAMPTGHERLSLDTSLILLDAGAMLAYAPYRALAVVTADPFAELNSLSRALDIGADVLHVRLHDSLVAADRVIAIGQLAFDAIAPLRQTAPQKHMFPPMPLQVSLDARAAILIVGNEDDAAPDAVLATLRTAFPEETFEAFDPTTAFDAPWKTILHIGLARSTSPGARLSDAWAGGVPVLQLIEPLRLGAQRRRQPERLAAIAVEHGKTGLLCSTGEQLVATLGDFLLDPLPARAVARGARRRIDPVAEWDVLLKALLQ